jgi:hypothetical protein
MDRASEVAQRIGRILQAHGAVPYVAHELSQPAQPGYVVFVLLDGATAGIELRHLPASDDALRHLQAYRRSLERGLLLPGLHLMLVLGPSDDKLVLIWHGAVP